MSGVGLINEVAPGKVWVAGSGFLFLFGGSPHKIFSGYDFGAAGEVIIPVDHIPDIPDDELGRLVRQQAVIARAVWLCTKYRAPITEHDDPDILTNWRNELVPLIGIIPEVQATIEQIDAELNRRELRTTGRLHKSARRREIQVNYDHLFVTVGRRDSFRCQGCGTSDNLQIDHKIPLDYDGSNDLDNLQLLCGPCNSRKGNR